MDSPQSTKSQRVSTLVQRFENVASTNTSPAQSLRRAPHTRTRRSLRDQFSPAPRPPIDGLPSTPVISTSLLLSQALNQHENAQDSSQPIRHSRQASQVRPSTRRKVSANPVLPDIDEKLASPIVLTAKPSDSPAVSSENTYITIVNAPRAFRPKLITSNSTATLSIAASQLFARSAKPLHLPHLDKHINSQEHANFSDPSRIIGEAERAGWDVWINQQKSKPGGISWWHRIFGRPKVKPAPDEDAAEKQDEKQVRFQRSSSFDYLPVLPPDERARSIFPPFHLLPANITVTLLMRNRHKPVPAITLDKILTVTVDGILGIEGSSYAIAMMKVEIFRDVVQMMGLFLTGRAQASLSRINEDPSWSRNMFQGLSDTFGLDLVSAFGFAIIWLFAFTLIAGVAMFEFYQLTGKWSGKFGKSVDVGEGYDQETLHQDRFKRHKAIKTRLPFRQKKWYKVTIIFILTTLYVPLSKISIGALAWTSDYWPITNPYLRADDPVFEVFDPQNSRKPTAFCYTTTMRQASGFKHLNYAFIILPVCAFTVLWLTIWFPLRLARVAREAAPTPSKFTDLGDKRKDTVGEYERLLESDTSPFSFLYNSYRQGFAGFKSTYMGVKLLNVLCVTVITKDNCIFRGHSRRNMDLARAGTQLALMTCFLVFQIYAHPNIDRISNNSDWCSRIGYVIVALFALFTALKLPGPWAGWLYITVLCIVYLFNIYFAIVGTNYAQQLVKKAQNRIDFSVDIFSPRLDLNKHIARRVWQETLSVLLLTEPNFKMDAQDKLHYATLPKASPYLLAFRGSHAERHIENVQILRSIGLKAYTAAVEQSREDPDLALIRNRILSDLVGPDCYWRSPTARLQSHVRSYFGRAVVCPFPYSIIFYYDDGNCIAKLESREDLMEFVIQNYDPKIRLAKRVRLSLRALEGKLIYAPYEDSEVIPSKKQQWFWMGEGADYSLQSYTRYRSGVLTITRNSPFEWNGYKYASGFKVSLIYRDGDCIRADGSVERCKHLVLDGPAFGVDGQDFALNPRLARIFTDNKPLIEADSIHVADCLLRHRDFFAKEAQHKVATLSYSFLLDILGDDALSNDQIKAKLYQTEIDSSIKRMTDTYGASFTFLQERMAAVQQSKLSSWWYLFWDEIWRRNASTIAGLTNHIQDFHPYYLTSICYRPLDRPSLEAFLRDRGLWKADGRSGFFTVGLLNQMYFYLDEILFAETPQSIPIKVGPDKNETSFDQLSRASKKFSPKKCSEIRPPPATRNASQVTASTAEYDATEYDDAAAGRNRPAFKFEEIYDPPHAHFARGSVIESSTQLPARIARHIKTWLGLQPVEHRGNGPGVWLSLRKNEDDLWTVPRKKDEIPPA